VEKFGVRLSEPRAILNLQFFGNELYLMRRDPQPIASVQPQDACSDCTMIRAEIEANNAKAAQLANEQGGKVAQTLPLASWGWSFGPCGSGWISKMQPARKPLHCKRANNT
jgi:hypothetical protein